MGANLLHFTQFASMAPAQFFIASLWQGLLLTMVAWVALKASPTVGIKISPGTRFVLWMIVFILSAVLPFSALLHIRPQAAGPHSAGALFSAAHLPAIWAVAIVGIWALASLFSMGRLLWNISRLDMLARTSSLLPVEALNSELRSLLENCAGNKSGSRRVEICLSDRIDSPVVIGFFRPAVVVPRWLWRKLNSSELNQIVMHELAHLERRDDWTNLLQKFLRALFPLNPALLLAERQLCSEREMACDDAVLDGAVTPKEYATCLTNLAENRLLRRVQSLAPGVWRRHSELAERVRRVLEHKGQLRPLHSRAVIGAFLAVYLCAGFALSRCPRLVAFTSSEGSGTQTAMEARSTAEDFTPKMLPADFRTGRMNSQGQPHVIDATFRTAGSLAHLSSAHMPSPKPRSAKHRVAARSSRPAFSKVRFTQPQRTQAYLAQAMLAQSRLLRSSLGISPAVLAQALFTQALFVQASEQNSAPVALSDSAAQLLLYLSTSSAFSGNSAFISSPIAVSQFHSGWIIIQL